MLASIIANQDLSMLRRGFAQCGLRRGEPVENDVAVDSSDESRDGSPLKTMTLLRVV